MESIKVTGHVGGTVSIRCKYSSKHKDKYLCKMDPLGCLNMTMEKNVWVRQERFAFYDNTFEQLFHVFITELKLVDAGKF